MVVSSGSGEVGAGTEGKGLAGWGSRGLMGRGGNKWAAVEEALGMRVRNKEVAKYLKGNRQRGWIKKRQQ